MATVTLADIEAARRVIAGTVLRTPTLASPRLSALTGAEICIKYENLQATGSFKERGALNKLASLTDAEKKRGVVSSAGVGPTAGLRGPSQRAALDLEEARDVV